MIRGINVNIHDLLKKSIELGASDIHITINSTPIARGVVQYPLWLINVGFLIGSVLTLVFSVYKIYHVIKDLKRSA